MKIPAPLQNRRGVVLDTMIFIYVFEDSLQYGGVCEFIINQIGAGVFQGAITPITAAEMIVKPLEYGRDDLADQYRHALKHFKNIETIAFTMDIGYLAGSLRAKYGLPLPDTMQLACALNNGSPALITNDKVLRRVEEVEIFLLDDFY